MFIDMMYNDRVMTHTHWNERFEQPQIRKVHTTKIKTLVEELDNPDETTRVRVAWRLISFGADAVDHLVEALEDEKKWIAASVLLDQILIRLEQVGETIEDETVDKLVIKVLDKQTSADDWIIKFLKRINTPHARKGLIDLLAVDDTCYTVTTVILDSFRREIAEGKYCR